MNPNLKQIQANVQRRLKETAGMTAGKYLSAIQTFDNKYSAVFAKRGMTLWLATADEQSGRLQYSGGKAKDGPNFVKTLQSIGLNLQSPYEKIQAYRGKAKFGAVQLEYDLSTEGHPKLDIWFR
jgi:hypothetical protein